MQIPSRSVIIERKRNGEVQICLYYNTNAKIAEKDLKNWCACTPTRSFAPIAVARRNAIIRARCIRRRARRARNARGIVKPAAVVSKNNGVSWMACSVFIIFWRVCWRTYRQYIYYVRAHACVWRGIFCPKIKKVKKIKKI